MSQLKLFVCKARKQEKPEYKQKHGYIINIDSMPEEIPYTRLCEVSNTVKILKFGAPQTTAIIVLKIEKFDATLH